MLAPLLSVLLAAAPVVQQPRSIPPKNAHPRAAAVVTPEGIGFRLPPGFAHSTTESEGRRVHVATSADGSAIVLVTAFASDAEMPCEAEQEGAAVESFETARGLRACRVSALDAETGVAIAIAYVKAGEAFVAVNAVAPGHRSRELTASVADSVTVPAAAARKLGRADVPRSDPGILGCFEHDVRVPGALAFRQRCFAEDLTFTQKFGFGMSTRYVSAATGEHIRTDGMTDRRERRGIWTYSGGTLRLEFEDGGEAEYAVELAGDDLLLNRELWRRMSP